jgi:hypothetical protein
MSYLDDEYKQFCDINTKREWEREGTKREPFW